MKSKRNLNYLLPDLVYGRRNRFKIFWKNFKTIFLNRLIIFCIFFSLIFIWISFSLIDLSDNKIIKPINASKKYRIVQNKNSHWSPPKFDKNYLTNLHLKLRESRRAILTENSDEFFQQVEKSIDFEEIDLISQAIGNIGWKFDWEIGQDMKKIQNLWGAAGQPVYTDNPAFDMKTREDMQNWIKKEGFNLPLSEMISPNRSLPDSRPPGCDEEVYDLDLPRMSVIVICHNEPLTTLMRTIHSVINTTPRRLLEEIILVDDTSSYEEISGGKLLRYLITQNPIDLIRLIRVRKRAGLIKARMIGAHFALGKVLFFLDSHMEKHWAEPLLQRIKEERKTLISPVIKSIEPNYLAYIYDKTFFISGFKWDGWFNWIPIPPYENYRKKYYWSSTRSPSMMGAAFLIERKYFWEIGSFDPGMEIWGGENLELPFRIWMCGGSVEIHPCSRAGHLYRVVHTYNWTFGTNQTETLIYNMARTAEVWMDEYKELFYLHYNYIKDIPYGDISARKALRNRLNCKSFKWFLDNFYKEKFLGHFDAKISGQVLKRGIDLAFKSELNGLCLDSLGQLPNYDLGVFTCYKYFPGRTQILYLTRNNELRLDEWGCLSSPGPYKSDVKVVKCSNLDLDKMEKWDYDSETRQIVNLSNGKCLTLDRFTKRLNLQDCVTSTGSFRNQKWIFIPLVLRKKA